MVSLVSISASQIKLAATLELKLLKSMIESDTVFFPVNMYNILRTTIWILQKKHLRNKVSLFYFDILNKCRDVRILQLMCDP